MGLKIYIFQSWKNSKLSASSPLTELIISDSNTSKHGLIKIMLVLTAFGDQALTKLVLAYVEEMTVLLLERIVTTYPHLHELALLDQAGWPGDAVSHSHFLASSV